MVSGIQNGKLGLVGYLKFFHRKKNMSNGRPLTSVFTGIEIKKKIINKYNKQILI